MWFLRTTFLVLGASEVLARVTGGEKRQEVDTIKYCPGSTTVCFSEFLTPTSNIIYRIAIPDVSSAPFDILLQIVAPISTTGWAGLAWGGSMTKNPLTIGWASGSSAVASSRWATGRTLPQPYTGATYTVLPTSTTNATHWQLDVLCSGCSQWAGLSLNPNGPNTFAWAKGSRAVTTPSSNASNFAYHDDKGVFSHDLSLGKIPKGVSDALAYDAGNTGKPSSSSTAASSSSSSSTTLIVPTTTGSTVLVPTTTVSTTSLPTVVTSVTTLPPRPSTTTTSVPTVVTSVTTLPPRPSTTTVPTVTTIITTIKPSTIAIPTSTPTTIITRPTTSFTWTPDPPLTTKTTVIVVPPKPTTTTVILPPWGPPFGIPPFGRPPFRGPPWRRPPGAEENVEE